MTTAVEVRDLVKRYPGGVRALDLAKITEAHRRRRAVVYVRQSTPAQLERNHESRARQYALRQRAIELGWPAASV